MVFESREMLVENLSPGQAVGAKGPVNEDDGETETETGTENDGEIEIGRDREEGEGEWMGLVKTGKQGHERKREAEEGAKVTDCEGAKAVNL